MTEALGIAALLISLALIVGAFIIGRSMMTKATNRADRSRAASQRWMASEQARWDAERRQLKKAAVDAESENRSLHESLDGVRSELTVSTDELVRTQGRLNIALEREALILKGWTPLRPERAPAEGQAIVVAERIGPNGSNGGSNGGEPRSWPATFLGLNGDGEAVLTDNDEVPMPVACDGTILWKPQQPGLPGEEARSTAAVPTLRRVPDLPDDEHDDPDDHDPDEADPDDDDPDEAEPDDDDPDDDDPDDDEPDDDEPDALSTDWRLSLLEEASDRQADEVARIARELIRISRLVDGDDDSDDSGL